MKKVLLINGSPNEHGNTDTALREVAASLNANGIATELLWLGKKPMPDCIACGQCRQRGSCVFDDAVNAVNARLDEFGGFIVGSPVYYGGPTGRLTSFLDRLFFSADKSKLAGKFGACAVVCRRGGATASFDRLNKYFTICNMHVVGSQYWNQVHGRAPGEAAQDAEGLQTMRTLGANMAYLMKAAAAAAAAGVAEPVYEEGVYTNFIR